MKFAGAEREPERERESLCNNLLSSASAHRFLPFVILHNRNEKGEIRLYYFSCKKKPREMCLSHRGCARVRVSRTSANESDV